MSIEIGNIGELGEALANFREMANAKHDYIEENTDESGDWDVRTAEGIADYDTDLAYLGERLADAVAKALGVEEES
ncbi:hypothetical protein SEA_IWOKEUPLIKEDIS_82 [Mycobacterium phage Iwokeuplikedis]|nr:hypothetical protein SEA_IWOKEUPLIKEDIS_82 [Mycobacterium phage Iwokeuplikedis]